MQKTIQVLFYLLGFLPFVATWPYYPYVTWGAETVTVLLAALIFIASIYQTRASSEIRLNVFALTSLAVLVYILLQLAFLDFSYSSFVLIGAGYFLVAALLTVAVDRCRKAQIEILIPLSRGLLTAGWIQVLFVFAQVFNVVVIYNTWVLNLPLWIPRYPVSSAIGLFFQRNQTVDFVFISLLASIYLFLNKKMSKWHFYTWVFASGLACSMTVSRSFFLFSFALILMSFAVLIKRVKIAPDQADQTRDFSKITLTACLIYLPTQFLVKPIFAMVNQSRVHGSTVSTSFERFAATASDDRFCIWKKGLMVFDRHPWFGVGWGNFGAEGNRLRAVTDFSYTCRTDDFNSNAHNLILQLLAEVGIIGTAIIGIGVLFLFYRLVRAAWNPKQMFILGVFLILFAHSLVEYPLWYSYFFFLLTVMVAMFERTWVSIKVKPKSFSLSAIAVGIAIFVYTALGWIWYNDLREIAFTPLPMPLTEKQVNNLNSLSRNPLLANMADFYVLIKLADNSDSDLGAKLALTERLLKIRPVTFVFFKRALYLSYLGNYEEALALVEGAYKNSAEAPSNMQTYLNEIKPDPRLLPMRDKIMQLQLLGVR